DTVTSLLAWDDRDESVLDTPLTVPAIESIDGVVGHPWTGREIGAYRILAPIASGGMGFVFLGEPIDPDVDHKVAIKILRDGARSAAEMRSIRVERQILTRLAHPNIARALDGGTTDEGLPYMVLEYLEGEPITEYCDAVRLDIGERLEVFRKVCHAVDFAHRRWIVHRDLKPGNILVTEDGEPKLLDFGLAKHLVGHTTTVGRDGFLTPSYASPEQLSGSVVSMASDVYSLGVVLHEVLTGVRPQRRTTPGGERGDEIFVRPSALTSPGTETGDAIEHRARDRQTTPAGWRQRLAGDLDCIVLHCLHDDPEQRYPSVGALERDLRRHSDGLPVSAQPPSWVYRFGKFVRRHRLAVLSASLAVAVLIVSSLALVWQNRQVVDQRDRAEAAQQESEAVTRFLTDTFLLADPYEGLVDPATPDAEVTAVQVLDHGTRRIHRTMADQPLLKARVLDTVGSIFSSLSRDAEAESLLQEALAIRRLLAADRPEEIVSSLNSLIFLYLNSGRPDLAEPLIDEAFAASRDGAVEPLIRAGVLANGGMFSFLSGDLDTAETRFRAALAMHHDVLPANHRDVILIRRDLGALLSRKGSFDAAEEQLRAVLDAVADNDGTSHVRYASTASELAWLLSTRGEHAEAGELFRSALDTFDRRLGPEHRNTVEAQGALALYLRDVGEYAEAEALMRENLVVRRRAFPDDITGASIALNNLGLIAADQGDYATAETVYRQALQSLTDRFGTTFRDRHTFLLNLGKVILGQGRAREAEALLQDAARLRADELGPDSPGHANSLVDLARAWSALGRFDEALEASRRASAVLTAALPDDHPRLAKARGARGEALVGLGRYDEAEPLLLASFERLADAPPGTRAVARRRLCALYRAWSRPDEAARVCADPS
ncbi:MAG: serine/threonine-protein kinase, partial [Acidobacteriota bacterium]